MNESLQVISYSQNLSPSGVVRHSERRRNIIIHMIFNLPGILQAGPLHPGLQVHRFGAVHVP